MHVFDWARKVQAIAQSGLTFTKDPYDKERFEQLQALVAELLASQLQLPTHVTNAFWDHEHGYATPKVDVRGAVFRDNQILLVRERSDGKWTLPGGWVDVNDSPSGAVEREVLEESGYETRAVKLAAVYDRRQHPHPPTLYHIYKLFFLCKIVGGSGGRDNLETDAVGFYALDNLPDLSTGRVTQGQIARMFAHHQQQHIATDFD